MHILKVSPILQPNTLPSLTLFMVWKKWLYVCPFFSKPWEFWPLLRPRSVFRPGAHTLPPGHPHLLQAADQHAPPHSWEKAVKRHERGRRGEWGRWRRRTGWSRDTCPTAQHGNPCWESHQPIRWDADCERIYFSWRAGTCTTAGGAGAYHTWDLEEWPARYPGVRNGNYWTSALLLRGERLSSL